MSDKVSIGLPVVKHRFFRESLTCILGQTYPAFELIILNNASRQDEKEMIRNTLREFSDRRIAYHENEVQLPIVPNWNRCLSLARNDLFVLFSDDDLCAPDFLKEMVELAGKYPDTDVFHCRVRQIDAEGKILGHAPLCPAFESQLDFIWHAMKGVRLQFAPDFMCRTGSLRAIGGFIDFPLAWGSDYVTWFTLARKGGVAYSPKTLVSFRVSEISLSNAGNIDQRMEANRKYKEWIDTFIKDYRPADSAEADLADEIRRIYPDLFLQKNLFLLSKAINGHTPLRGIKRVFTLKKKHQLPAGMVLKALLTNIFRRK